MYGLWHLAAPLCRSRVESAGRGGRNIMNRLYYLPPSTARLLSEERIRRCKNLGLILDKYIPQEAIQKSEGKGDWFKRLDTASHIDPRLAEHAYLRWRNTRSEEHTSELQSR